MSKSLWHTIRKADGSWPLAFGDVQAQTDQHGPDIGQVSLVACTTNQGGDVHVLALDGTNRKLWHTIRLANGSWPYAFGDVQAQTDQHGANIGQVNLVACATNQGGDVHVLALDGTNRKLWHTIRLANGSWPYAFGDVQAQTDQHGPDIGQVSLVACATNRSGDLHVLALDATNKLWHTIRLANGSWPFAFGDVQAQTDQHGANIGGVVDVACATNQGGDLHVLALDGKNYKLWYTIRLADGSWPFAFGDVQAQTGGNIVGGSIENVACATNQGGDLHVCAANGVASNPEIVVPYILEETAKEAKDAVLRAGFVWDTSVLRVVNGLTEPIVKSQGPPAGTLAPAGTTVHAGLWIPQAGP
jgi:hypothetical protein